MRKLKYAFLILWKVTKNVALEPVQQLRRQLDQAFWMQFGLNMGAFFLFSILLQLLGWFTSGANLFIAYVLGYTPEIWAKWKACRKYPSLGDLLRWSCGAATYLLAKEWLNQHCPIGSWEAAGSQDWFTNLWLYLRANCGLLLLHTIAASSLGYAGELGWVWSVRRWELLKKALED
jgi:hypothetical protein